MSSSTTTAAAPAATDPPPDAATRTCCDECQAKLGRSGCMGTWKKSNGTPCASSTCSKILCPTCATKYPLIVFDPTTTTTTTMEMATEDDWNDLSKNNTIQCFCQSCFQRKSVLDFSRTSQVMEPPSSTSVSPTCTLLFAHGGGSSRAMFVPHAMEMCQKKGYRCILFDFPGHGSRMEESLTLESCVLTVKNVLKEYNLIENDENANDESKDKTTTNKKKKNYLIYIGASFGAYVGFYVLQQLLSESTTATTTPMFQGAILLDCGQNVGPGASFKARMGLWFLNKLTNSMSSSTMMKLMYKASIQSPANYKLVECTFGAGFFFQQGTQQIECLKTVSPAECLHSIKGSNHNSSSNVDEDKTKTKFPILYMNGSEDYRDSEQKWLALSPSKSELHVYEKGDHFFCHDTRFVSDMLDRWDTFIHTKIMSSEE